MKSGVFSDIPQDIDSWHSFDPLKGCDSNEHQKFVHAFIRYIKNHLNTAIPTGMKDSITLHTIRYILMHHDGGTLTDLAYSSSALSLSRRVE